jgi:hypothetical protein
MVLAESQSSKGLSVTVTKATPHMAIIKSVRKTLMNKSPSKKPQMPEIVITGNAIKAKAVIRHIIAAIH